MYQLVVDGNGAIVEFAADNATNSFKIKQKLTNQTRNDSTKN